MFYLVADIGGTHVRFRLIRRSGAAWESLHENLCLAADRANAAEAIRLLLESAPVGVGDRIRGACLAIAGPVRDGRASMTNIDWHPLLPAPGGIVLVASPNAPLAGGTSEDQEFDRAVASQSLVSIGYAKALMRVNARAATTQRAPPPAAAPFAPLHPANPVDSRICGGCV